VTAVARARAKIAALDVAAYTIPTDAPESDGTLAWDSTTVVLVEVDAGGVTGLGYTYADAAAAQLVTAKLAGELKGCEAADVPARWLQMRRALRNDGSGGLAAMAISAVDVALWDRQAKELGIAVSTLLGAFRDEVPAYGSGGFCSYSDEQLAEQLGGWARDGFRMVKMKVGRDPSRDGHRVAVARGAIGDDVALFADANGAWDPREAVDWAHRLAAEADVRWLEEPVSSLDRAGLRLVRERAPATLAVAAGEYVSHPQDAHDLLAARCVDVLQADATRCGGVTGFMEAAALCAARGMPLSSHCAPSLHRPLMCAARKGVHLEYFHDHARIEQMLFDGFAAPRDGLLYCDEERAGLGVELKTRDAERFRI
jgi:L-alanine-DL-glutamate epimerase-like enolase superfamily enzyme